MNDQLIDIATGKTRFTTTWKNRQVTWEKLLSKFSSTHRTHEKYAEYMAAKKERQDELKDVGSFVGGYLSSGSRKKGSVLHRQLITLDLDYANKDFWSDFQDLYGCTACLHSTHKHSSDNPRYRLIIPLSRPVFSDEYMAIAHKVAGILDIELFDPTTFQPERLMYWPSTSLDGEFVFEQQDGDWLDADAVLATYRNWKDSSEWSVSERAVGVIRQGITTQGDPLGKPGIIGTFCRIFTIDAAIEKFLENEYELSDIPGRYTYKQGSTAGGLVIYEDKFAYSHHSTDTISGKLVNAFDLVRLHKFGDGEDTLNKMISFATGVEEIKTELIRERADKARADFAHEETDEPEDDSWRTRLETDNKGQVRNTINNVLVVLECDTYLKGKIAYDDFEKCEVATKDLPWRDIMHSTRRLIDTDDSQIRHYLENTYRINNLPKTKDAMDVLGNRTKFHPVKDYLKSLQWDGEARVETLFVDYMGCPDNVYTREVSRKSLSAACARVFNPGCKFDTMVVFVGAQGMMKSEMIKRLGKLWFSDNFSTVHGKEGIEQLQGVWLVEMAELSGLKKADVEAVKSYITRTVDRYRVAYGRRVENFPRQCVFFGSTNKMDFLRDVTGNRRFWPLDTNKDAKTKHVFKDLSPDEADQVWAEAMVIYKKGETLILSDEAESIAVAMQEQHSESDAREGKVIGFLNRLVPADWDSMALYPRRDWIRDMGEGTVRKDSISVIEIWCELFDGMIKDLTPAAARPVQDILRRMKGWTESEERKDTTYGPQKVYRRTAEGIAEFEKRLLKLEVT